MMDSTGTAVFLAMLGAPWLTVAKWTGPMTTPGVNGPHTSSLVVDGEVIPATWFTGGPYNTYDGAGMPTPIGQDALIHWITTVNASAKNARPGARAFAQPMEA